MTSSMVSCVFDEHRCFAAPVHDLAETYAGTQKDEQLVNSSVQRPPIIERTTTCPARLPAPIDTAVAADAVVHDIFGPPVRTAAIQSSLACSRNPIVSSGVLPNPSTVSNPSKDEADTLSNMNICPDPIRPTSPTGYTRINLQEKLQQVHEWLRSQQPPVFFLINPCVDEPSSPPESVFGLGDGGLTGMQAYHQDMCRWSDEDSQCATYYSPRSMSEERDLEDTVSEMGISGLMRKRKREFDRELLQGELERVERLLGKENERTIANGGWLGEKRKYAERLKIRLGYMKERPEWMDIYEYIRLRGEFF